MGKVKMTMICEEEQITFIMKALDWFERLRIGQAGSPAGNIAFNWYDYSEHDSKEFNKRISVRNILQYSIESIIKVCLDEVGRGTCAKTKEVLSVEDLWMGLRYQCFKDLLTPEEQEERQYSVDSRKPFGDGAYPLAEIKLERLDDAYDR